MAKTDLTAARLRELLDYNPETGVFTWRLNVSNVHAGDVSGHIAKSGYIRISIDYIEFMAHRLAWLYMHGAWPENSIDHINGKRDDNRIENLRCATHNENVENQRSAHSNSKSGILGVNLMPNGFWRAQICSNKKVQHIGYFATKELAQSAYLFAKKQLHAFGKVAENATDGPKKERKPKAGSASGLIGSHWNKKMNKWFSRITVNGKRRHIGFFDSAQEAHDAYKAKQKEYFGGD